MQLHRTAAAILLIYFHDHASPQPVNRGTLGASVNRDTTVRSFRFVEALDSRELPRSRSGKWHLVDGWLQLAEQTSPRSPKALLEGDNLLRLPDGGVFKEVSFKVEHTSMESALRVWAPIVGRRWAQVVGDELAVSDGTSHSVNEILFELVP